VGACVHVTPGDVSAGPSAVSFEASESRHSSVHRRQTAWRPPQPDDDVDDDVSDVDAEVVVKLVQNETMKQGTRFDLSAAPTRSVQFSSFQFSSVQFSSVQFSNNILSTQVL